jgi:hypothetical protein
MGFSRNQDPTREMSAYAIYDFAPMASSSPMLVPLMPPETTSATRNRECVFHEALTAPACLALF